MRLEVGKLHDGLHVDRRTVKTSLFKWKRIKHKFLFAYYYNLKTQAINV
jgi:hypothetical protein